MKTESAVPSETSAPGSRTVGRYVMYDEIASGGMASVHFGRLVGAVGFARMVAIKHLHPHHTDDADFESMFVDEARLASRIRHPNVAALLDVVSEDGGEIFLVMEYIHGVTLTSLIKSARAGSQTIPHAVAASIMSGALHGLHAAHEAVDEAGQPLNIVHRDVSPQNIMVGSDGVARVLDFGVAKAVARCQSTRQGQFKGKLSYMSPEQMRNGPVDRRADVFAAGIVLWEVLTQKRLFKPDDAGTACAMILSAPIQRPSTVNRDISSALDHVVMKALERDLDKRFQTALELADALEEALPLASHRKVGKWVERLCGKHLVELSDKVSDIERTGVHTMPPKAALDALRAKRGDVPRSAEDSTGSGQGSGSGTQERNGLSLVSTGASLPPSTSARLRAAWPTIAGGVIVLLLGSLVAWRLLRTEAATKPTQAPPAAVAVPPPAPPSAPTAPAEAAPEAAADQGLEPTGGNEEVAPATPAPKAKGKGVRANRAKRDCDPPYTIDARGIRRVKPHCL